MERPFDENVELGDFFTCQREACRRHVFFQMGDVDSTGDGKDDRAVLQEPGERDLPCCGVARLRDAIDKTTRSGQLAGLEWKPRDEANVVDLTIGEHVLAASVDEVVAVLHRRHRKHGASVRDPLVRPRAREARLGRDQQSFIGMKRLADQLLRHIRAVTVGRVDEVDADLTKPA